MINNIDTEELRRVARSATPGDWSIPHLAMDDASCNCTSILSERYAGSIAKVSVDNGKTISDGGNDSPPLAEAKANAVFMATFNPSTVLSLLDIIDSKQAEIDVLMLEFCPNEITKEQMEEWARHQKVSDYQPPREFEHSELPSPWLSIDVHGQPKTAGFYDVLYSWEDTNARPCTYYYDGLWYDDITSDEKEHWKPTSFGNDGEVSNERYRESDKSEIVIIRI